jgi:putative peptidoglycan lipid II flippase
VTIARDQAIELDDRSGATSDSMTVAGWTLVSRITGVVKVAVIAAVLGPTFFGNAYQFTNSLPNLLYFGLLAGSLFSSLLVPELIGYVERGDSAACSRIAGGFLGATMAALAVLALPAVVLGPLALRAAAGANGAAQEEVGRYLVAMFLPQLFLYGVVGTATAVMNAHRRFALAAAAPAMENIGTIAVLAACAALYGTGTDVASVPTGELLLLGFGTSGAVAVHAATQWIGARRVGVVLLPRAGWRDAEVRSVLRRALPSMAQASLVALQIVSLLVLANRVAGGVIAFQIALNFYFLAIALGATPVALALLPRLARMHMAGADGQFRDSVHTGAALGLFVAIPAAIAYAGLAVPLAQAVAFGRMGTPAGVTLVAAALAALAPAVVGQTMFLIATYASYARKDTRAPLRSMVVQAVTCGCLEAVALAVHGTATLVVLGVGYAAAVNLAAAHLWHRLHRLLQRGRALLRRSLLTITLGASLMLGPAWLVAVRTRDAIGAPFGSRIGVLAAAVTGFAVFLGAQAALHTPELAWLGAGANRLRSRRRRRATEVADV